MELNTLKDIIILAFYLYLFLFLFFLARNIIQNRRNLGEASFAKSSISGFSAAFCDALGIGSFAVLIFSFRVSNYFKDDKLMMGTMNVSMTVPGFLVTVIYTDFVDVDPLTIFSMVISATIGAYMGSLVVQKLPAQKIQLAIGTGLLLLAVLITLRTTHVLELSNSSSDIGFTGWTLIVANVFSFFVSSLTNIGIGYFAPCLAFFAIAGLNPLIAYPIMSAAAFVSLVSASVGYLRTSQYNIKGALIISAFGALGVLVATTIVKSLPTTAIPYLTLGIVIYAGVATIFKARS